MCHCDSWLIFVLVKIEVEHKDSFSFLRIQLDHVVFLKKGLHSYFFMPFLVKHEPKVQVAVNNDLLHKGTTHRNSLAKYFQIRHSEVCRND